MPIANEKGSFPGEPELRTYLAVCEVPPHEAERWLAAHERACAPRPPGAVSVSEARPRDLGVHAAIRCPGTEGEVPAYIERDVDADLRTALRRGADQGAFVLLVGGSSVGKTRTLYEAVLAEFPHRWLVHPADPGEIRRLTPSPHVPAVIWLDELQRYLRSGDGLDPGTVRALMRAGQVVVGTMWPDEYGARIARQDAPDAKLLASASVFTVDGSFTRAERERARQVALTDGRVRLALESRDAGLTQVLAAGPELVRWWEQAPEPYARAVITAAVDARRLGMESTLTTRFLADAAPGYLDRIERATAPGDWLERAVAYATTPLHGAASALTPVAGDAMGEVAGYLCADYLLQHGRTSRRTAMVPAACWEALVKHVGDVGDGSRLVRSARNRMLFGYAEPLYRWLVANGDMIARHDYANLLREQGRRSDLLTFYREQADAGDRVFAGSLVSHLQLHGDIGELRARAVDGDVDAAVAVAWLLPAEEAVRLLRPHAAAAHGEAATRLAHLLDREDGLDEVIAALRPAAEAGDEGAADELVFLLEEGGRAEEALEVLRAAVAAGNKSACEDLTYRYEEAGRLHELVPLWRSAIEVIGNYEVCLLQEELRRQARLEEWEESLRRRIATDDHWSALYLAELLQERGRSEEAVQVLRPVANAESELKPWDTSDYAADRRRACSEAQELLADLLAELKREDELVARAAGGDEWAAPRLADLLAEQGRETELTARAAAGDPSAAQRLARLLADQGRTAELEARAAAGDGPAAIVRADMLMKDGSAAQAARYLWSLLPAGHPDAVDRLIGLLARDDDIPEVLTVLRARPDAADGYAISRLVRDLEKQGRVEEFLELQRARAAGGDPLASSEVARLLAAHGRADEAVELLLKSWPDGDQLIDLLVEQGRVDEAIDRIRSSPDGSTHYRLAALLGKQGRTEELRLEVRAGTPGAADRLCELLHVQGTVGEEHVRSLRTYGLNADGSLRQPGPLH
ncbi:hypothetical protein [Actinoplanes sp. NPDC049681]|uniref:hypothetical protein n=1 Tax=Actinoplanes sp. NPDC049681 TaxID=3363905 RepID=UPI0037B48C78